MQLRFPGPTFSRAAAVLLASTALVASGLQSTADAATLEGAGPCLDPATHGAAPASAAARGGDGLDHRPITAAEQERIAARTRELLAAQRGAGDEQLFRVRVQVHVMAARDGTGNVRRRAIERQITVMNEHFAGAESEVAATTRFRFVLKGVDRYRNNRWHRDGQSRTYRRATRVGGPGTLNLWVLGFDYLGVATFPWDYRQSPGIDGIRVDFRSLPGGAYADYDQGKTASHEAGHWLGLFHTFQGGCTQPNDEVEDTPAQLDASVGCPADGTDTCALPGADPVHNYMDYSFDECMDQFTPGQKQRMRQMWRAYRR